MAIEAAHQAQRLSQSPDELGDACAALGWFHLERQALDQAEACMRQGLDAAPQHAVLQFHMGSLHLRRKEPGRAAQHLSWALQLNPDLDEAAVSLAWALHDQGQLALACAWARHALQREATPARQAQLAWLLLCQGQPRDALPLLRQSLAGAPHVATTYAHLARALAETGQHAQAQQTLDLGLARCPDAPALLLAAAWSHHERHDDARAATLAQRFLQLHPDSASAWHLLGVAQAATGHAQDAASHLSRALALDGTNAEAAIQLALLLRKSHRHQDAVALLADTAQHHPQHMRLCALRAQIALDLQEPDEARQAIHALLAKAPDDGNLWYLLAQALRQRGHSAAASTALRRAVRHEPGHAQAWLLSAWHALQRDQADTVANALTQWLRHAPDPREAHVQAAFILAECGQLKQANRHAEQAISRDATFREAWRALAYVSQREGLFAESETHIRHALSLGEPADPACLRLLAWTLRAQGDLEGAGVLFRQVASAQPQTSSHWFELADTLAELGAGDAALQALEPALTLRPPLAQAQSLRARLLSDAGPRHWEEATRLCASTLRRSTDVDAAAFPLMTMAALGHGPAAGVLRQLPHSVRLRLLRAGLAHAQARSNQTLFCAMADFAQRELPTEPGLAATALYAMALRPDTQPHALARAARAWQRTLTAWTGGTGSAPVPPHLARAPRLRLAYVAAHFHRTLLTGVLAAHNPHHVDVFLYADLQEDALRGLPSSVRLMPLRGHDLVASMHANRIDVAIDTVGVGGMLDQDKVLQQFARRVAPIQCAWLGSWASSGGVFDCLLTDANAVPPAKAGDYTERVVHLPGGQWSWTPPAHAPDPGPPPCLNTSRITLGCAVRAMRMGPLALHTWTQLLQRLPQADLVLLGTHGASTALRTEIAQHLHNTGIDPNRIRYEAHRPYDNYLSLYHGIDIVLDSFPANGGLCLLDALWMGLPCVSLAGHWAGERQGLSVLAAVGHPEWVANDAAEYLEIVCTLAAAPAKLAALRASLRQEMLRSTLLDGRRMARAVEDACHTLRQAMADVAEAPSPKERARAIAAHQLDSWLEHGSRIDLAPRRKDPVDISVVIVLFNQAGLSRQCFAALADQEDAHFETIVVDNASSDRTAELLLRLDGATLIRNAGNLGFLHAANQGAAQARGRHILFLNNDAILHPHALRQAVRRLDADASIGAVGGRIVLGNGLLQEAGCITYRDGSTLGYGRGKDPHAADFAFVRDVDFCSGAFLMLRSHLWSALGGFDPVFAPAYYEDTDLCLRIQDAGYRVVYDPSIWLTHFEWASATSADAASRLMQERQTCFAQRHRIRLASRPLPLQAAPHRDRWSASMRSKVLFIDNAVPHMAAGGGLPRARLLVQALAAQRHVTLFPLWQCDDDWHTVYASLPETVEVMLGHGAAELESFLEERKGVYDYLLVSRPPNMAFVDTLWRRRPELFDSMRLVYDAEAVFALRDIGQASLQGRPLAFDRAQRLVEDELSLVGRAETVLSVSEPESALFRNAGAHRVELLSHAMPTRLATPDWADRAHLLFIGAIHPNTPNEDGLLWFCEHVMPILQRLEPNLLHINAVGDCTSEKVAALADDRIHLVGRVDDLTPWYDSHRVFVAPTRFGAGVPAKVIEAACNGLPVVATPLLARQLGWQDGADLATGEDAAAFAQALLHLYHNPSHWQSVRTAMTRTTRERYDPAAFQGTVDRVFPPTPAVRNCLDDGVPPQPLCETEP